jgi:hypothetical protein
MIWRNGSGKTKNPITIWKPKDFYDSGLKKWFRACGVLAVPNLLNFNGEYSAGLISRDGGGGWTAYTGGVSGTASGVKFTTTWYLKAGTATTVFVNWGGAHTGNRTDFAVDLLNGTVSDITLASGEFYEVESAPNGFYRIMYSSTLTSTTYFPQISPIASTGTIIFGGIQIERNSHATPFTTTSRSNTQGLLDLTGNNTIDLSNVSFDSNAKMVFDGTNDYIGFGDVSGNIGGKSQATMELILKVDALQSNDFQQVFGFRNGSDFDFFMIIYPSENSGGTEFRVRNSAGTFYDLNPNISSYVGNYLHVIFTVGPTGRQVYFNNVLAASSPTWTGNFGATSYFSIGNYLIGMIWSVLGEIPVAKLYDRELSTTEITNNYLKYKRQYGLT